MVLSVSSSSWCLGRFVVCDCGTPWTFLFPFCFTDDFQDGDNGIPIRYGFDGKLFNLRRLQAKSNVQTEVLDEFLFADDMAKGDPTEEKMQKRCGSSTGFT